MKDIDFTEAVIAFDADGETCKVNNVAEAEDFLLSYWYRLRPESLTHAVMACLLYCGDDTTLARARDAFIAALSEVNLLD